MKRLFQCKVICFIKNGPTYLICLFSYFSKTFLKKIVDFSINKTPIIGIEGKYADHLTTTTTQVIRLPMEHFSRRIWTTRSAQW